MPYSLRLSMAVLASALTLGCVDQQSPTAPPGGSSPSFSVIRGTTFFGVLIIDEERGLTTVIGNTFAELAGICAGTEAPDAEDPEREATCATERYQQQRVNDWNRSWEHRQTAKHLKLEQGPYDRVANC